MYLCFTASQNVIFPLKKVLYVYEELLKDGNKNTGREMEGREKEDQSCRMKVMKRRKQEEKKEGWIKRRDGGRRRG